MEVGGIIALAIGLTACLLWLWRSTPPKSERAGKTVGHEHHWIEPTRLGYGAQYWLLEKLERYGSRSAERAGEDGPAGGNRAPLDSREVERE